MTDLELLRRTYPDSGATEAHIANLGEELAQMLKAGYLGTVTYGIRRDGKWLVALSYTARSDGSLVENDRAGQVPRGVDVTGGAFYSYMTYSSKYDNANPDELSKFLSGLPIQRTTAPEPGTSGGIWTASKTYSADGTGVSRKEFKQL